MSVVSRPRYVWPDHDPLQREWLLSAVRGLRNAIVTATQIRLPYVLQAAWFCLLYRGEGDESRLRMTIKQSLAHGRDLGLFVLIYKSVCSILRHFGLRNGAESWIAGLIGGWYGFGDDFGVRGSVNFQIVLYLLSRGVVGLLRSQVAKGNLPPAADVSRGRSFRCLAAFALALILYLTEHEPESLQPSFMRTMTFLYHESDKGPMLPPKRFLAPVLVVFVALFLGAWNARYSLESFAQHVLDRLHLPAFIIKRSS